MVEYNPLKWSWTGTKQFVAETSYDILDPIYGEGGVLEPVTVIVDPDRTVKEEYIAPAIDYSQDALDTFREASYDSIIKPISDVTLGLGVLALVYLFRS